MAIAEFDPSRRDFLTFGFARRRRPDGNQPPRRPTAVAPAQPEPPDGSKGVINLISRRNLLRAASGIAGAGIGLFIADKLGLLPKLPLNEAERLGQLLETFDPSRLTGFNLEANSTTTVGNVTLGNSSSLNDITLNLNALSSWLNTCRITALPNYQMGIEFADVLPDGSPRALERTFDNMGDFSIIRVIPPSYLRDGNNLLTGKITAPENPDNANKRALLKANIDLAETMCALGGMAEKLKQGITDPNILRMEDSKASQLTQAYLKDLLEDKRPLIFTVRPSRKTS